MNAPSLECDHVAALTLSFAILNLFPLEKDDTEKNHCECFLSDWVLTPWPRDSSSAALNKVF